MTTRTLKTNSCCFTGHRLLPKAKLAEIQKHLENEIIKLINQGVTDFLDGGALGFDMLAAERVLMLRPLYPQIKLIMVLPCKNQDERWRYSEKQRYRNILNQADENICLSEKYYDGCMLARNRYMVDHSSYCVAYLTQNRGGTFYTVNYAKKCGVGVVSLGG